MVVERSEVHPIGNFETGKMTLIGEQPEVEVAGNVSERRLWDRIMQLAQIGATETGGVTRLALSKEEIPARRLLISWAQELELNVYTDDISNLFFRLEGTDVSATPVMSGSHIDSQPNGGKFDGAFGVIAALEVLQAIRRSGYTPYRSIEAVVWLNEEGSRFAPGMMGSDVFTGKRSLEDCLPVKDSDGISFAEALTETQSVFQSLPRRQFGYEVSGFVEAHIEQGPVLEAEEIPVGVVSGIQGSRRFRIRISGEQAHAGTEPMTTRKDALFSAMDIVQEIRRNLHGFGRELKFTVGMFEIYPNAPSVVPSSAYFSIDIRHPDNEILGNVGRLIREVCNSNRGNCGLEVNQIAVSESLQFPTTMQQCISRCAELIGIQSMRIYSLAGHDARQLHYHCPTGMIFAPCHKGISHSDKENCNSSDLVAATRVLAASMVNLAGRPSP